MTDALLLLAAVAASAFFSATESALFSLSRLRLALLARDPSSDAQAIVRTMAAPNAALAGVLIGNGFANLGGTAFATVVAISLFGRHGVAVAVPVMTVLIIVLAEICPKTIAILHPERVARHTIRLLDLFSTLVWPLRVVLERVTSGLLAIIERASGRTRPEDEPEGSTTALFRAAVLVGHDEGILAPFEKEIFDNITDVHDLEVREVMTPRTEIFALPVTTSVPEARRLVKERRLSRVPVYEGRFENLVGLLHAAELLPVSGAPPTIRPLLRPLYYVPESKPVVDLLAEFRVRKLHFAVAVEESGGFAGIVTLEDILEEIVGEIRDEQNVVHQRYVRRSDSTIVVSARMEIETFNEIFGVTLSAEGVETIGGFILERIGRIPRAGEILFLDGLRFLVRRAEPHRLVELEVTKFAVMERVPS